MLIGTIGEYSAVLEIATGINALAMTVGADSHQHHTNTAINLNLPSRKGTSTNCGTSFFMPGGLCKINNLTRIRLAHL